MSLFWKGVVERLADVAAFCICVTSAFAVIHIAYLAPEFAAVVIGAALVALAIYKRPGLHLENTYTIDGEMRVETMTANVDARILKALLDAARCEGKPNSW